MKAALDDQGWNAKSTVTVLADGVDGLTCIIHERRKSLQEAGLDKYFPEREKQDVFPAASRDGFTAVRKILIQSGRRTR
jgi:hypothetical protein